MTEDLVVIYENIPADLYEKAAKAACTPAEGRQRLWRIGRLFAMALVLTIALIVLRPTGQGVGLFFAGGLVGILMISIAVIMNQHPQKAVRTNYERRRGPMTIRPNQDGCRFESSFGASTMKWLAFDEIVDLGTGTGLRSGLVVSAIPNDALPEDMSPKALRTQLETWRTTA